MVAITGESRLSSARRAAFDAVTGGTRVLSDVIKIRITANPGEPSSVHRSRPRGRREAAQDAGAIAHVLSLTIIFLIVLIDEAFISTAASISRSPCSLLCWSALSRRHQIGLLSTSASRGSIASSKNVLAMRRAPSNRGDVDVLLLDKTGTITLGSRQAAEFPHRA